jgi:hypothetical protein
MNELYREGMRLGQEERPILECEERLEIELCLVLGWTRQCHNPEMHILNVYCHLKIIYLGKCHLSVRVF